METRSGRIREVCRVLGEAGVNILELTVADTRQFDVLRLIVDNTELAVEELKKHNFAATAADIVIAGVQDRPGALADLLDVLAAAQVNIEYMHAFMGKADGMSRMIFRFENTDEAVKVLQKANVPIITSDNLKN